MAQTPYTFGSFNLNDGKNYFVNDKVFEIPQLKVSQTKIARIEGMKKTGDTVNSRTINVRVRVIGSSRTNLEQLLDTLYWALSAKQAQLCLHALDNRYYICDCVNATTSKLNVVSADVSIQFLASMPYALSASASSYDTGAVLATSAPAFTNAYNYGPYTITGGGNIYARLASLVIYNSSPTFGNLTLTAAITSGVGISSIQVQATTNPYNVGDTFANGNDKFVLASASPTGSTTLQVYGVSGGTWTPAANYAVGAVFSPVTAWTSVQVTQNTDNVSWQSFDTANLPVTSGSWITLVGDPTSSSGMGTWTGGVGTPVQFSGQMPWMEPGSNSWTITVNASVMPTLDIKWSWTPRWLS